MITEYNKQHFARLLTKSLKGPDCGAAMNNTPPKPLLSPEQAQANEAARVAYKAYSEVRAQLEPLKLAWQKAEQHAYNMRHKA